MIKRLDPDVPVVWRAPHTVQFGVEHVLCTVDDTTAVVERMLHALARGATLGELRVLAETGGRAASVADELLAAVGPALLGSARPAPGLPWPAPELASVAVDGTGPTAERVAAVLTAAGVRVVGAVADADAAIVIGAFAIQPGRYTAWLNRDVPHLAVIFSDREVRLGPFVEPGSGPCLRCVDLARRDLDPAWPAIASQVVGTAAASETTTATSVALRVVELVRARLSETEQPLRDRAVIIDSRTGAISERRFDFHPECGCRALPEIARGFAHDATIAPATSGSNSAGGAYAPS